MRYNAGVESNLRHRLQGSLPAEEWELLTRIAKAAGELGLPLYVVGGLPRDVIIGVPSSDFDLVVEGRAEHLAHRLQRLYGGKVRVHSRFGTAKWDLRGTRFDSREQGQSEQTGLGASLDFVTARSETYKHAAALPTVKAGTIEDDLRRRDFSINALAIRLDGSHLGELRDDLGGLEDLRRGIVRVLHESSFVDDPTRMYRAVRYEQRYGFRVAQETLALLPGGRALIETLSAQRIRRELDLILQEGRADAMLARLAQLDLLKPIHPDLFFDDGARVRLSRLEGRLSFGGTEWHASGLRWLLWLMVLPGKQIRSLSRRLHFHADLLASLLAASKLWGELESLRSLAASQWVEHLHDTPLVAVAAVYVGTDAGPVKTALLQYLSEWRYLKPKTTGHDLKKLGVEPGPQYKTILGQLRRAWLDGRVSTEEEEREYLLAMLERGKAEK